MRVDKKLEERNTSHFREEISFCLFFAQLHSMRDLSSLTRDRTCVLYNGSTES